MLPPKKDTSIKHVNEKPQYVVLVKPYKPLQTALHTEPVIDTAPTVLSVSASSMAVTGCGDNFYANFIYKKESNCNLNARNYLGCLGIGQACPGSKLLAVCPNLDYACQNSFFTAYANKYGGWAGAYQFWLGNGWW